MCQDSGCGLPHFWQFSLDRQFFDWWLSFKHPKRKPLVLTSSMRSLAPSSLSLTLREKRQGNLWGLLFLLLSTSFMTNLITSSASAKAISLSNWIIFKCVSWSKYFISTLSLAALAAASTLLDMTEDLEVFEEPEALVILEHLDLVDLLSWLIVPRCSSAFCSFERSLSVVFDIRCASDRTGRNLDRRDLLHFHLQATHRKLSLPD